MAPLAADEAPLPAAAEEAEAVVVLDELVLTLAAATPAPPDPGTVNVGAPAVSEVDPPPPQAARPAETARTANRLTRVRTGFIRGRSQSPSGAMRRPQYGQSFRSFWAS